MESIIIRAVANRNLLSVLYKSCNLPEAPVLEQLSVTTSSGKCSIEMWREHGFWQAGDVKNEVSSTLSLVKPHSFLTLKFYENTPFCLQIPLIYQRLSERMRPLLRKQLQHLSHKFQNARESGFLKLKVRAVSQKVHKLLFQGLHCEILPGDWKDSSTPIYISSYWRY